MIPDEIGWSFEFPSILPFLLKVSLILVMAWIVHVCLRRCNPRWRILLWRSVVCSLILIPVLSGIVPVYEVDFPAGNRFIEQFHLSDETPVFSSSVNTPSSTTPILSNSPVQEEVDPSPESVTNFNLLSWVYQRKVILLSALWSILAFFMAFRLIVASFQLHRFIKRSKSAPTCIIQQFHNVTVETGCTRPISLRCSSELMTPILCGLSNPVLLLPERMTEASYASELPGVFAHELAHLQSRDLWWVAGLQWLQVFLWFHPLVWRMRWVHDSACDEICDAFAADYMGNTQNYSKLLAQLALDMVSRPPVCGGITMATKSDVRKRLEFLKTSISTFPLTKKSVGAFISVALLSLLSIAGLQPLMQSDKAMAGEQTTPNESEGISIKQIWKASYSADLGTVSADGMYRSYIHWGNGDVAVHNLITGEKKILTHDADLGDSTHFAQSTVISKNGNKIAYSWWNPRNTNGLRLIDVNKPSPRLLYRKTGEELYPSAWLSDKDLAVIRFIPETKTTQMVSFDVLDKTEQALKTFDVLHFPQLACSPDEKYLAYDFKTATDNGDTDINIMLPNGDNDISLITHPANDRVLGWVPGRQEFLFTSDRSGSWDLWALPLDGGKPSGPVKKIYADIGEVTPIGFTENGDCYFGFSRRNFSTYLTPFNAENGELNEKDGKSLRGSNLWVTWSPDGQSLAYISEDAKSESPWQLTVKDLKTGQERKLAENLRMASSPSWSPDGKSIIVLGREKSRFQARDYKGGIFVVDVKTGQTTEILLLSDYKFNVPDDDASPLSDLEWSADGKSFYCLFFKDRLVKHDLESGEDKVLYEHTHFNRLLLNRSPDGNSLLLGVYNPEEKKSHLFTIPADGGTEKELCTTQDADNFAKALWSPDGQYIYFTERKEGTNLWRIRAEGGIPQKIWHSENRAELFSIHPNGKQMAFSIRERTTEIRVIQNLGTELSKVFKKIE